MTLTTFLTCLFGAIPQVLMVGDSITLHTRHYVATELAGDAEVWGLPENGRYSGYSKDRWEYWRTGYIRIGGTSPSLPERFDVVVLNHGLWDVTRLDDGSLRTPPDQYEENMRALIWRALSLNATAPRPVVIVSTTTPIPHTVEGASDADVQTYNAILRDLVAEYRADGYCVLSNDLYAAALPNLEAWQVPDDIHFNDTGRAALAAHTSGVVRQVLTTGCATSLPVAGSAGVVLLSTALIAATLWRGRA